jgi:hypothetical protein
MHRLAALCAALGVDLHEFLCQAICWLSQRRPQVPDHAVTGPLSEESMRRSGIPKKGGQKKHVPNPFRHQPDVGMVVIPSIIKTSGERATTGITMQENVRWEEPSTSPALWLDCCLPWA